LWPETLSPPEREEWEAYRHKRLVADPALASIRLDEYRAQVRSLMDERPEAEEILRQLAEWPATLGLESGGDSERP
jgi:exodeoxyribonuclease-1